MKLSRKLKQQIKKSLTITLASIALITTTLATMKLADISMPFSTKLNSIEEDNQIKAATVTRLENTDTITYIYDAQDLVAFRDAVNAGDSYEGKTVYLMDDIDLSIVCSSTLGSWEPIGGQYTDSDGNKIYFSGTFDGNYHVISNLYINSDLYASQGLFSHIISTTVVQNIVMKNVYINNNYNSVTNTGAIAGSTIGSIKNIGIESGTIKSTTTTYMLLGGVVGYNNSTIINCYNNAELTATLTSGDYLRIGGICGQIWYEGKVENCYNTGTITSTGSKRTQNGGIAGSMYKDAIVENCYNTASVSGTATNKYIGGIVGQNGESSNYPAGTISNSYCLTTSTTYSYYKLKSRVTTGRIDGTVLEKNTVTLGSAFAYDVYGINSGYPVLAWQNNTTVMELNKNQAYIKVGENLQLNVVESDEVTEKIGNNYANTNFKWTSTNEDVATVNEQGLVTGVSDGYATIYAYHETSGLYAMAIINVAKDFTNPQIETGNGFTAILKSNGTVWTIGNNGSGQLGNGTTENATVPVQVYIDEDTTLSNIVKIAVGTDHVIALTNDGKVYGWGSNTYGQLGQNNTESTAYAKPVLSIDGASYLSNIVDIAAGAYGTVAVDKNGNVYVWGRGTTGEIGNETTISSNLPVKTTIENAIQVSIGAGHVAALTSEGVVWSWGQNTHGQLGINCANNTSYPMKTVLNVTELSLGGYHTTVKKIDGTLYATGAYNYGRLGTGSTANATTYIKVNLPSTVTETNKVKYVKAGILNTTLLLTDGTVWETGFNFNGELGNGTTTTSTSFVQGLTTDGILENILTVGKNNGNIAGSATTGYGLNTAVITKDGDIYTTGDNAYGQIGNYSNASQFLYYTKMGGEAYISYAEPSIEMNSNEQYTIDEEKIKITYRSINVYGEEKYEINNLRYTSLDEKVAIVNEDGVVTAKDISTGTTKIKIEDLDNGFEIYITIIVNRLNDTDTVTYIYNAKDLADFRDTVNAGDDYAGKCVYVMADIDMSSVCSEELGVSWTPIGYYIDSTNYNYFAGTFDGNYHKISNLYINSNLYGSEGLFSRTTLTTILQNVTMEKIYINNTYSVNSCTGAIAGTNIDGGIIQNVGIESGEINSISSNGMCVGGIVGNNNGNILNCYNKANIKATLTSGDFIRIGGISGQLWYKGAIINCYSTGTITSVGKVRTQNGGVVGSMYKGAILENSYSIGDISGTATNKYIGGVVGQNGENSNYPSGTIINSYCLTSVTYSYYRLRSGMTAGRVAEDTLKTYATTLGQAFEDDDFNINSDYPILWWEAPTIELNKKQEYIKVGEQVQLRITQNEAVTTIFGTEVDTSSFVWSSTNEDIATVDANGLVTGLLEGYTTIYGYNETYDIYTMCVINVAKEETNPQVETGNGFTAILKSDGTVWTIGKNENGQLGDGTNEERIEAVQVKTDENTYLTNVVKISVGEEHVLALTSDGKVYAWGANTYGQLGQNNTEDSNYAKLVLGEGGSSTLDKIVDISAGSYGSSAINEFGWNYVWGNGTYGEIGNGSVTSNYTPAKNTLNTAVSVSIGAGHTVTLAQNGKAYTWGRNTYGELGVGNTTNSTTALKVADAVSEVSAAGFETVLKKVDGTVYGAGLNTSGELATGTTTNVTSLTEITLPTTVTEENQVKYIKAGKQTTSLMLDDSTVWTAGNNTNGTLGNGSNENSVAFVQAETEEANLENALAIGRNNGVNIATVNESGRVYTTGLNTYGQIGNNTKDDATYFTVMGYIVVEYPEKINLNVGETLSLSVDNFAYIEKYFNVYEEDITKVSLVNNAKILDSNIATYENGVVTGQNIGSTTLMVKEETTGTIIYIPVNVLPENGQVTPNVKTANNYTVTLKSNGTVWTFGANENGELGLGDNIYRNVPEQVELLADKIVEQISVGNNHVIALTEDGEVYTWGLNTNGQLGLGNTKHSNIPQKVEIPESTALVQVVNDIPVKVIANGDTSYVITQDGKVYAWGEGFETSPKLLELENEIIDISNNYALDIEGNVYNLETNTRLEIAEKIKYISESATHTVFLSESGLAYAIGSNTYGQFGDGTNVSNTESVVAIRNEDVTDVLRDIVKVEAGNGYTLALLSDGKILATGINSKGQLGTDEIDESNVVVENTFVSSLLYETKESINLMDAGNDHSAIALSNGDTYTWGTGVNGELGNGNNEDEISLQLVGKNIIEANTNNLLLNENETFELEANTTYFNLLQDIDGEISYQSKDETVVRVDEKTGNVTAVSQGTTVIVAREIGTENISVIQVRVLPEGIDIEPQVSTNGSHTVTLKVDGTVWSYGDNTNGELGNGTNTYSDEPVQAEFPEETIIKQVVAGENFSAALDTEGNVWTWGANDYYQLGNSSVSSTNVPTKVEGLSNITKIAAGTYSMLAINENKEVYGWGLNSNGELGIGSYTNKVSSPTKAKYMTDVIDIAVGKNHSIALKSTGEVYVTGLNIYGQLGNNDTSIKKVELFTKVESLTGVARISATDSGNIVSTVNGDVYAWGLNIYGELGLGDKTNRYSPTLVENLSNIILVDGGKNHSVVLDKYGNVSTSGSSKYGQLGNGTNTESLNYVEVTNLTDVMTISAGNTYTAIAKEDGTVWGFGDYNHGDKSLKSKTTSLVPMQVGNDTFGLGTNKITIKKSETVSITSYMQYSFNLIYLDKNTTGEITYESSNEEIAIVNELGEVLGVKEGLTWVKAIEEDGKEHVVYVYVTDNESDYAPEVTAGEDFASVLKSDGTIWTFGHNNNGELGIGSNKTKDVPEKTNVIQSYKEISSGESFTIAIRADGTVWSYGKNNYGQLGVGNTKNGLNPVQVNGITDIVQIATGKEHSIALDSYGILYGWGRNNNGQLGLTDETVLTPTPISYTGGTINSIFAGDDQTIIINTKGEIYGYGSILNGTLAGIENAVKVSVGEGYMIILTTEGKMYKYEGTTLSEYTTDELIVDIDVTNNNIIAQTVDEKVYTFTSNTEPVLEDMKNVYNIAAGVNNSYVIKTDGTVYARGTNTYGQLGNSTRIDSLTEFTLIGDRNFTVEPESKIMYVNDVEQLTEEIQGTEFNVFNKSVRNGEEYTWKTSDENIVTVDNGELTAIAEGTAQITITDNITGAEVTITRVVIPVEKDRIEIIKVDDNEATIIEEYKYYVEVETNSDKATLVIKTKDTTDKISIDDGANWYENGTLTSSIDIPNEETEISIIVETSNGTQIPYTLIVKKISTDVSLENITVDGITATATSATNYEVVVPEDTTLSEVIARANSTKAKVSINGEGFLTWKSITTIEYEDSTPVIIPILVEAENGDELEYTLTVYKESAILQLESLTVNEKEATRTSEGIYSITIARDLNNVEVTAKAVSELVKVSINSANSEVQVSTKEVTITDEMTEVTIRLSTTVDGVEVYRDYTLNIYKKAESGNIEFVIVNGVVLTRTVSGYYETYLPAETESATVKVIAQNEEDYVQIAENTSEKSSSEVIVETLQDKNQYIIKIIDSETSETKEYTLYINKPSVDATISKLTVSNGEYTVTAKESTEEENVYIAKVMKYDNYTVTAITNNINAYVSIEDGDKLKSTVSKVITRTDDYMEVKIEVESENGDLEEYLLKIYIMSSDTSLDFIKVNETDAILQTDGSYLVNLETAETEVSVTAETISEVAEVRLEDEDYELHTTTRDVTIDSKDTIRYIYVKAEDGTTQKYKLVISGLPDDATLQKVVVNGVEARYIEGENKYEIRTDSAEFEVEAIATDSLAKVSLNDGELSIGSSTITVTKAGSATIVTIKVVAQDGVDSSTYTLEIKEKSSDNSIGAVTVNGNTAKKLTDGNYEISVVNSTKTAVIKVEANDSYATVYLDGETENTNNITVQKEITDRITVYTIKVVAEDGTEEEHTLTITRLNANVNIEELTVNLEVEEVTETEDEETGEIIEETTIVEKTYIPELQEDGTYYIKVDRVENADIKAVLEDANAYVKIKNSAYVIAQNEVTVDTVSEKTTVIISVKAEDETTKDYTLIIEKKSNDTTLKTISSEDMLKLDDYTLYVDENLTQVDLTLITNSAYASIKLDTDAEYTPVKIIRTIDLSEENKTETDEESGWFVNVQVLAEDGTLGTYTIAIVKTGNTNITSVKVEDGTIENKNDVYTARVNVADTANVEITSENENATVEIIQSVEADDGTVTETVIASATGTLNATVDLNLNPENYKIKITSANGSTVQYYDLVIEQKSTDTSISYVKVNNITAIETEEGYKSVVSGSNSYPVVIKATDENAKVKIAYNDYEGEYSTSKLEESVPVEDGEVLEVTITVQSENGDEQDYKLFITRISDDTALEYVKVSGETCTDFNELTNTYTITVDNELSQTDIEVKSVDEQAKLTINSTSSVHLLNTITALDGPGTTKKVTLIVEAEDGTTENYYINIVQLSSSISLEKIVVNDKEATKVNATDYEITITDENEVAKIVANTKEDTSTVSIDGETAVLASATKTVDINGHEVIEMVITVTAEDGTMQDYNLKITILEASSELSYVKVNTGEIKPEEDGITYKTFIAANSTSANIEIKTQSTYANIEITNKEDLSISNESLNEAIMSFTVDTPNDVATINYTVTSETGVSTEYTIVLTKISTDNTLKELYVEEQLIEVSEDGKYYYELESAEEVTVKAIANNEYASIRIDYNEEERHQTEATINAEKSSTKVTITITSQSGVTTKYYLFIRVLANNTLLDKVLVGGVEVTDFKEETMTYTAIVDNTEDTYEVFLMAVNDSATVELYNGEDLISSGVGSITDTITLEETEESHEYKVKVSLDEEHYTDYTLVVMRTSSDTSLKLVEVNDVVRTPTEADKYVYEVGIPKLADTAKIRVEATNSYAKVKIGDNEEVYSGDTITVSLNLLDTRTTVPVVVTAVDGTTIDTFNILLIRQSNIAELESVIVNSNEVENVDDVYTYYMGEDEDVANVEISTAEDNNAIVEVDGNQGIGYLELEETFEEDTIKIEKTIKVTSEDGTVVKEYTLVLCRKTQILGIITTQNANSEHISQINLYKEGQEEAIQQIDTNVDGSYEINIDEVGIYKVVVTKLGYLSYTVTDIEIVSGRIVELEEYSLMAGDVVSSGEIEIDDLVSLNDNYGVIITDENKEDKAIYDLNEDGTIDKLDRNILKANYGKLAEEVEWINPNAIALMSLSLDDDLETTEESLSTENVSQDFILPMACEYVITSEYGYRVHPITGVTTFHSGIDIVGDHHTEILAVSDGEVTYAGVQSGYGNCIEIKHIVNGETIYSFYAHLSQIDVQVGQIVSQGEVIGLEGGDPETDPNPGTSTGHHLHFELRSATGSGNSLNPNNYIEF